MALGTPVYRTTLDTAATIGPTSGIVPGVTKLSDVGAGQGDQLGILNNIISLLVALETKVGVDASTDPTSLDARISTLQNRVGSIAMFKVGDGNPPAANYAYFQTRDSGSLGVWRMPASSTNSLLFASIVPPGITFVTGIQTVIWWASITAITGFATFSAEIDPVVGQSIDVDSYGTAVSVNTTVNGSAAFINSTVISLPIANLQGLASEQPYKLKISRAGATDTMADSADIWLVEVRTY